MKYHYAITDEDYDNEEDLEEAIRGYIDVFELIDLLDGRSASWIFDHLNEEARMELFEEAIQNEKDDWVVEFEEDEE